MWKGWNFEKKRDEYQNSELPDLLIYRKKKYIIPGALLLFLALLLLSVVLTLGIVGSVGEDVTQAASEMFQLENVIYLLPGFAILEIPALLIYAVIDIGERRFLRVYQKMPAWAKQKLCRARFRNLFLRGLGFYEAAGYILFNDRCLFGTPQIVQIEDIVWGYLGRLDVQFSDEERNFISPGLQFFSLCFYTKDGRRHRIFANVSYKEVVSWFTARCPRAILGYGKEQKRQAEEIFRREAERTSFLSGEEKDSYLVRKRKTVTAAAVGSFLAVIFLTAGFCGWRYINSDEYLYRKNMKQADSWYAAGEYSRAYNAYSAAGDYRPDDEEVQKGRLLSCLGMAKNDGYLDSIIRDYENLFYYQDLFTDEMDISDWYFDCAGYYLQYDDPMAAVDLLERGMETFSREETVVENGESFGDDDKKGNSLFGWDKEEASSEKNAEDLQKIRENILRKMQNKKEDILAHCEVETVTLYLNGEKNTYTEYDEAGREILTVDYYSHVNASRWIYKTYDDTGNLILEETWYQEDDRAEKEKRSEVRLSYDEEGRVLHEEEYNLERGEITYESSYEYDAAGNQIYFRTIYSGRVFYESECCVVSDLVRIDREYNMDRPEGDEPYSYVEQRWDETGNELETAYYPAKYTPEEIEEGKAKAWGRYYYTYDAVGNCTGLFYQNGETGTSEPVYEREYDDRNNLIKEVYYYSSEVPEDCYQETTIWHYDDRNLLIKKEWTTGDDVEEWGGFEEIYTYDEAEKLVRVDYLNEGKFMHSVVKEYDILGNQIKECRTDAEDGTVSEDAVPDKEWNYRYRYRKENLRWGH